MRQNLPRMCPVNHREEERDGRDKDDREDKGRQIERKKGRYKTERQRWFSKDSV